MVKLDLYFTSESILIWPTKQQIVDSMLDCFKNTYPSTRVIIDCTELYVQVLSSLAIQSALYSSYKHCCTYKGLLGISLSGAVTFISQLYPRFISDKEIVAHSGFLNPAFWEAGDSVMADRGFNIQDALKELGVELNIPAFLDGHDQLEEEEVIESQTIASVRIHVERYISRLKKFRLLNLTIPLTLHGYIYQICTVAHLICNFMDPLIKQDN